MTDSPAGLRYIGLALGSGSARGWSHLGVLRALEEKGLRPAVVSGASVGALVAAAYASGQLARLEEWVGTLTRVDVWRLLDATFRGGGVMRGNRLMQTIGEQIEDRRIEDLPVAFGAVAADLNNGEEIWLRSGSMPIPVAAVLAVGINPLVRAVIGFDSTTTTLITWTTRACLITLTGYTIQEIAARAFYAREEPMYPLYAVMLRIGVFLLIGIAGLTFLRGVGAPIIALAEIALLIEAIVMFGWLSRKMHQPIRVWSAVVKGGLVAVLGGLTAYLLAVYLPGSAVLTALVGMVIGGLVALPIIWTEIKLLAKL